MIQHLKVRTDFKSTCLTYLYSIWFLQQTLGCCKMRVKSFQWVIHRNPRQATNQVIVSFYHLYWLMANICQIIKITLISASLQDIEIQYRFSWFCHIKFRTKFLFSSLHIIELFASYVIGLYFTVDCEKDTGTLTGLCFCNPESWFQFSDISLQIVLHVHSYYKYGDHVSSAT